MAYRFLPLIAITGLVILFWLPHTAYSDFTSGNKYLIQATGFASGSQDIFDSTFDLQLTTGSQSGSSITSSLDNGLVTINGDNYLNTGGWTTTLLRDGKYLLLQGNAQDQHGNNLQVNLFGRQIDSTQNGIVYSITGKISSSENFRVIYSAKATITGSSTTVPTSTPTTPTQTPSNAVRISIVSGASNSNNLIFFSPSTTSVSTGTTIIWTNNDKVSHRIMSGVASAVKGNGSIPTFAPDGMIDSGTLAPGQSFQYTITNFNSHTYLSATAAQYLNLPEEQTAGDITFFDPNYTWMIGVINPASTPTQAKMAQISILQGASTATSNQNTLYLSPISLQVTSGTTIVWTNHDSVSHRILSGQYQGLGGGGGGQQTRIQVFNPDGKIDSGTIAPGQSFQYTITGSGTFTYYDPSNTWLNGNIIVASQTSQAPTIQVSILSGSSLPQGSASQSNQYYTNGYYTPDQIQIAPGATIIWTNNDNVAHSILSGTATLNPNNPYVPDGRIKSGSIAPGQSFQITINDTGIIRFYDPSYTWMNGVIVSIPSSSQTHVLSNTPPTNLITPTLH